MDKSKEVVKKEVEQVGPTLGIKVHGIKSIRAGGDVQVQPAYA